MKIATQMANTIKGGLFSLNTNITIKGKIKEHITEDNETMRVNVMIKIKHNKIMLKDEGYKARIIPTKDATPLPPLNPAKMGNTCPKTADAPKSIL